MDTKRIGQQIKKARISAGMTQKELAEKLGIPYQGIGQWERGIRTPKLETLQSIADALGVSIIELLDPSIFDSLSSMLHVEPAHLLELMSAPDPESSELRQAVDTAAFNLEALSRVERAANELNRQIEENRSKLNAAFDKLNISGQEKAVERVEELTEIPKYLRGTETPPEAPDGPPEAK